MASKITIEYNGGSELSRYKKLEKSGFKIYVRVGNDPSFAVMEGQKGSTKISTIQDYICQKKGIHTENQRLFLAGEELDPTKNLAEYYIQNDCEITLKSFIPVLVSSLECPGPMLTEIEVSPLRDDTIRNMKFRLSDKLGIDADMQRLYLSPDEMTSFIRRRELDDSSLLNRYLAPSSDNNLFELRPRIDYQENEQRINFRVPITMQDARKLDLDTLPHEIFTKTIEGWLSLESSTAKIIKRDPTIGDIMKIFRENFQPQDGESASAINLKFMTRRLVHGGLILDEKFRSGGDYQMRAEEELLKVSVDGNEAPDRDNPPTIPLPKPIPPLVSYNEKDIRYTMPKTPTLMQWDLPPPNEIDVGAKPKILMEISAFSNSKLHGSWDVAEHYKTYVEIMLEGTFYVGDTGAERSILERGTRDVTPDKSYAYYSQNYMEITVVGPEGNRSHNSNMINKSPMRWYRKSADMRKHDKLFWEQTLDRRLAPPPFRYNTRPINLPERTDLEKKEVPIENNGHSKLIINNWYIGKEKVSDIMPNTRKGKVFDTTCERGETISGSPFLKFKFKAVRPDFPCEEQLSAFDFRIQAQFYICTLEENFTNGSEPDEAKIFTISAHQGISRTERIPGYSDTITQFKSPASNKMQTSIEINLANGEWMKRSNSA